MSRIIAAVAVALMFTACVSESVVYQRSLASPHLSDFARHLPRADFEQIAQVLAHRTRQSIVDIQAGRAPNQLVVDTAFPDASGPGSFGQFTVEKRDGRWHVVYGFDEPLYTG